jgi:hypothetical protein
MNCCWRYGLRGREIGRAVWTGVLWGVSYLFWRRLLIGAKTHV